MRNYTYYIALMLFTLLVSCGTIKRTSIQSVNPGNFSLEQKQLILKGKASDPMRVFLITNYEDSLLLRQNCDPVTFDDKDKTLRHFIQRLHRTVTDSMSLGVGIAAPQVGILKRIIWVKRFDKPGFPFEVYLNPEILQYSTKKQPCPEGCLSIPNRRGTTTNRAYAILLQSLDQHGEQHIEMVEDFTAVIFQHEIDHLNGILFIDHLKKEVRDAKGK